MTKFVRFSERVFVWGGGALFAASLACCAYVYAVPWSQPPTSPIPGRWPALGFDAALLTVFALHHSILARERVRRWLCAAIAPRLHRAVYVWTASALLIAACLLWHPIDADFYRSSGLLRIGHGVAQLAGVLLIALSVRSIDPLELAGIRQRPTSGALQTTGPYRLVRHPLYMGWTLAVFGAAHMTGDRLAFAVITVAYLVVAVPFEERSLITAFGDDYRRYRREVRWRIVPYVY